MSGHGSGGHGEEHGGGGIDPMKLKMGILVAAIVFIVVTVTVFTSTDLPALASGRFSSGTVKAKEPVMLAPQAPRQIANQCDSFVFDMIIGAPKRCR